MIKILKLYCIDVIDVIEYFLQRNDRDRKLIVNNIKNKKNT